MTRARPRSAAPARSDGIALVLGLTALAWLAASFSHVPGIWGLDTLRHAPAGLGLLAVLALGLAAVPAFAGGPRALARALGAMLGARGPLPYAALALVMFALLLAARDPLRFVGDSGLRLAAITVRGDTGTVFPQAALLDRLVNLDLPRTLRDSLPIGDADALQVTGALMGALWAAAGLALLRALALGGAPLGAAMLVLAGSGVLVHFAGYDKFGPVTLGLALTAAGAARALQGARPWMLALGVATALLAHRSGWLVLPAALIVLAVLLRRGGAPRRDAYVVLVAIAAAAALALPQVVTSVESIDRTRHLSGWAPAQLWDAAQLLFLLAPLWPAGLLAAWTLQTRPAHRDEPRWPREARYAAVAGLAAYALLLVAVRGSQGAARDWDMHVPGASLVALASAASLGLIWQRAGEAPAAARSMALALVFAAATSAAMWTLHTDVRAQLARIDDQLRVRKAWTNESWARAQDFMGLQALRAGRPEEAVAHWNLAIEGAPNPRYFYQVALAQMRLGRLDSAREWIARTEERDPANADVWVGRAMLASGLDSVGVAIGYADSALARQPRKWDALELRRKLLQFRGK